MAKRDETKPDVRPGTTYPTYVRFDGALLLRLDEIAAQMRPQPSRASLVELAVEEYVERHAVAAKKKPKG